MAGILAHFRAPRKSYLEASFIAMVVLVGLSFILRAVALDHIPGLSGDEALGAVQFRLFLRGEHSEWITPSGRPYALPYLILLAPLQFFRANGWLLRLPSLICGMAPAILAWPLLRRVLPEIQAKIATVWIACLALHIAYSRISWEPSQIPLAALLITYFGLRGNLKGVLVTQVIAIISHTVTIFLLPIGLAPIVYDAWRAGRRLPRSRWLVGGSLLLALALGGLWTSVPGGLRSHFPHPIDFFRFAQGLSRIFSGWLAFGGFGPKPAKTPMAVADFLFMLAIPAFILAHFRDLGLRNRAFAAGIAVSILALFITGGQTSVSFGHERHCLHLGVPVLVLLAMLCPLDLKALVGAYAWAAAMLVSTVIFYFLPIVRTGGAEFHGYRAGPVDPKIGAAHWILEHADSDLKHPLNIATQDWWAYWIVYFHTLGGPPRPIEMWDLERHQNPPGGLEGLLRGHGFFVGYPDTPANSEIEKLRQGGLSVEPVDFADYSGAPFVRVWYLRTGSHT